MSELVTVRILGMPLEIMQRSAEHSDELLREFALIREEGGNHVPARLLDLIEELRSRFGGFSEGPRQAMFDALERGDETIDLTYQMPPEAAVAAHLLGDLLDEADEFCRAGHLLTLVTPNEDQVFRHWYLDEFERQIAGQPPRPWPALSAGQMDAAAPGRHADAAG